MRHANRKKERKKERGAEDKKYYVCGQRAGIHTGAVFLSCLVVVSLDLFFAGLNPNPLKNHFITRPAKAICVSPHP
jgi:hypothetical protein